MKITCDVIKDILPLYAEGLVSADTAALVEEHLALCETCKQLLTELRAPTHIPADTNAAPLKKVRSALKKQRVWTIIFSVLVSLVVVITALGYVTSPEYIRYIHGVLTVTEHDTSMVTIRFDGSVAGYKISSQPAETGSGTVYFLTSWDSVWNRVFGKNEPVEIVLNPDGGEVTAVYYYLADETEDILIYGEDIYNVVSLPRLFLAYYLCFALILAIICAAIMILTRKKKAFHKALLPVTLAPVAYLLAHLCIKGFSTATYSGIRDLFLILLAALPIYGVLLIFSRRIAARNSAKTKAAR